MDLYKEYALVDLEYKRLEEKRAELRSRILTDMVAANADQTKTDFGTFTIATKIKYIYTEAVKKIEERLKIVKMREEKKGTATSEQFKYLIYNEKK